MRPGGHDDLANAVAGVLVGLDLDRRQPLIRLSDVFAADSEGACVASPLPRHCEIVFAVVTMEGADVAVAYCGHRAVQAAALYPRRRGWAVVAGFLHRHGGAAR